ncbi:MAG: sulfatase, partial [Armatimonadota bacterium]
RVLRAADFWGLWGVTVGVYAALGWVAFGVLGAVLGAATALLRRAGAEQDRFLYHILGAIALPPALVLGRADLDIAPEAMTFLLLRVGAWSVAAGAVMWVALRFAPRLRLKLPGAGAAALGCLVAGALWAQWTLNGISAAEKVGAVAVGVVVLFAVGLIRSRRAHGDASSPARAVWVRVLMFWPAAFLVIVGWAGVRIAYPSPHRGAPNVLLVIVDALRADKLGCYGSSAGLTPELDRFARDAVVFDSAFASAPWTVASMGSIFVSQRPSEIGIWRRPAEGHKVRFDGGLFTPQPTLAEVLRKAGYMTAAELVNPLLRRDQGAARGFIIFRNPDDFRGDALPALPRLGRYEEWFLHTSLGRRLAEALFDKHEYFGSRQLDRHEAERLVQDASRWLAARDRQPFFLWMHLMDTHVPYNPPEKSPETLAAFPEPPFEPDGKFYKDLVWGRIALGAGDKAYLQALYDDEVRYADRWLGRLMASLRELGLFDNTTIIVTADHGEEFWDHSGFEHGHSMYDEVLRVPLLIKFPRGAHAGDRVRAQVGLIDVLPTVLDVAGVAIPDGVRGRSLVPLLGGDSAAGQGRELFAEMTLYGEELKALRTSEYKVIFHPESRAMEVYDLRADPRERHNLAADPQVAPALRERLLGLARQSGRRIAYWKQFGEKAPALDKRSLEQMRSIGYVAD